MLARLKEAYIHDVKHDEKYLHVVVDGRVLSIPLLWIPRKTQTGYLVLADTSGYTFSTPAGNHRGKDKCSANDLEARWQ